MTKLIKLITASPLVITRIVVFWTKGEEKKVKFYNDEVTGHLLKIQNFSAFLLD